MRTGIEWCPEKSVDNAEAELKEIRALGYDCVDFQSFCHTENIFFDGTVRDMEKLLKRVKIAAENAGIGISQTHGPWRWPPQDATEADRSERFENDALAGRHRNSRLRGYGHPSGHAVRR